MLAKHRVADLDLHIIIVMWHTERWHWSSLTACSIECQLQGLILFMAILEEICWKVTCLQRRCSSSNIENLRSLSFLLQNLGHKFSNLNMYQNHLKNLLKQRLLGLFPRVPDLVGLGYNPKICIANKFPVDDSVGLGTTDFWTTGSEHSQP